MPLPLSFASSPASNNGKAQIGLWFPPATYDVWAVDMMKQSNGFLAVNDTSNTWPSLMNSDGYPTAQPAAGSWFVSQLYMYGSDGDKWTLDWTSSGGGTTTISLNASWTGGSLSQTASTATSKEYTIVGSPVGTEPSTGAVAGSVAKVTITISALSGTLTSLRLYRNTDASRLNASDATAIFRQEFLDRVKTFGCIRFMDWANCNSARTYSWNNLRPDTYFGWAGAYRSSAFFYGTASPTATSNTFTVSTLPTLTNGLPVSFIMTARPSVLTVTGVTQGSPTQFTIAGHGLSNGAKVHAIQESSGGGGWATAFHSKNTTTGLPPEYTVTVVDPNTISLPIDSTAFAAPTTIVLMPSIYITDGVVSKRCYRMGLINHFNSEFGSGKVYPALYAAVYDATFDCFVMSGDGSGDEFIQNIPLSAMISLCNYSKSHPWFTFPFMTEDDFWTQLATYVRTNLRPGLKPRFEPGNEIWNPGPSFWQTSYTQSLAAKQNLNTNFGVTAYNLMYGKRLKEVSQLISAVYGTGDDWKMIMGSQQGSALTNDRLQGNATINGGSSAGYPGNFADEVATAPYTSPNFYGSSGNPTAYPGLLDQIDNYKQGGSSRNTAFAWLSTEMETASSPTWKASVFTVDDCVVLYNTASTVITNSGCTGRRGTGLLHTHYEGGPTQMVASGFLNSGWPANAPTSGNSIAYVDLQNFWMDWLYSTEMGTYMVNHMNKFANAGCPYPSQYTIAGNFTTSSNQGLQPLNGTGGVATPDTPAFLAFKLWNDT